MVLAGFGGGSPGDQEVVYGPEPPAMTLFIDPLQEPAQTGLKGVRVTVIGGGEAIEVVAVFAQPLASVILQV